MLLPRLAIVTAMLIWFLSVAATAFAEPSVAVTAPGSAEKAKDVTLRLSPVRVSGGAVSGDWKDPAFDDAAWTVAPGLVVPRGTAAPPAGAARPGSATAVDIAPAGSLYVRTRFDLDDAASVRSVELRVSYQDAFIAYLNGRELARRGIPEAPASRAATTSDAVTRPRVAHGAERETLYLSWPPSGPEAPSLRAKENILAVEVRPALGRAPQDATAPSVEMGIAAFSGVRIVRGPYLIVPGDGAVSVAWETNLPARGRVRFRVDGADVSKEKDVVAARPGLRQVVALRGLRPDTRYRYQVDVTGVANAADPKTKREDQDQSSGVVFRTAPRPDHLLRFMVYGDMRAPGHAAHAQVVAGLLREDPALVVNTGDLVAVGAEESAWQRYFEITAPLGAIAPVAPALGNHEAYVGGAAKSWALFGLRTASPTPGPSYTSFDWGGAHFVILDTNHPDDAQRDWLIRDLAQANRRHARAIFALCHDGPWSFGTHGGSRVMQQQFAPVLAAGGTDVLFSGHDHIYARGTGITARGALPYVVTGGGGAPLYNPTCEPATTPAGAIAQTLGVPSPLPVCPPGVDIIRKTYHYIVVEVDDRKVRICPRLPDGAPIEPCVDTPLRSRRRSGLQQ